LGLLTLALNALAFDSGSTGADGALTPTVNTEVPLPESGTLNYTSINIPDGVRVTFRPNASNTPVTLFGQRECSDRGHPGCQRSSRTGHQWRRRWQCG
jgi:hypothetical protein